MSEDPGPTLSERAPYLKPDDAARALARRLLGESRHAALATVTMPDGQPLATRVALSTLPSGDVVLLLSDLSEHSRALASHPRASLLVGHTAPGDGLRQPRLTLRGHVVRLVPGADEARARARYLARLPEAALYADFADFACYSLTIVDGLLNAGFARAHRLDRADLCRDPSPEMEARESAIIRHMNEDHPDSLSRIIASQRTTDQTNWRIATLDPLGFEALSDTGDLVRIDFAQAVVEPEGYRHAFVRLVKEARTKQARAKP
ncbi:hypothetical protein NS226_22945 [Aureimonas ureilytica]|uniref:Pyridoxamine 5'-phosphate oxidase n=1 Tax=Aureimonas ureilytica TaxID=401562 RepID=A0A175QUV1_9HYPH|nr:DUF2470 domain-containing protein [Aureimonas ureilytica]KTQ79378.1 hypothetical protein NS226_22945 [Aureimonas ureilytica]